MITRRTSPGEEARAAELFAIAFEQPLDRGAAPAADPRYLRWASFTDDGRMMSTLTARKLTMNFDGADCPAAGIGGVASLPQYRRCGGIRECFKTMLPELYAMGIELSYLYPFSTDYYRRFGYESCVTRVHTVIDLSQLKHESTDGFFRLIEEYSPLSEDIIRIDSVIEKRFNMAVRHEEGDYEWIGKLDPARAQEFCYVYYNSAGTPLSYTVFKKADEPDGRNLVCSRFCFACRAGFYGLLSVFASLSADHRYVKFTLPDIPAMSYLMPEWSLGAVSRRLEPAGMVRVINAEAILKKAAYIGSGRIKIRLSDPFIAGNNACFAVDFKNGSASNVERTKEAPDLTLSISAFSALISGVSQFDEALAWMDGIELHDPLAPCAAVFSKKPLMIWDYF